MEHAAYRTDEIGAAPNINAVMKRHSEILYTRVSSRAAARIRPE